MKAWERESWSSWEKWRAVCWCWKRHPLVWVVIQYFFVISPLVVLMETLWAYAMVESVSG